MYVQQQRLAFTSLWSCMSSWISFPAAITHRFLGVGLYDLLKVSKCHKLAQAQLGLPRTLNPSTTLVSGNDRCLNAGAAVAADY